MDEGRPVETSLTEGGVDVLSRQGICWSQGRRDVGRMDGRRRERSMHIQNVSSAVRAADRW